jgi:hypothetical protein
VTLSGPGHAANQGVRSRVSVVRVQHGVHARRHGHPGRGAQSGGRSDSVVRTVGQMVTSTNGKPAGNVRLGRQFTVAEMEQILAGADLKALVASAPRIKTREEMYAELFGAGPG